MKEMKKVLGICAVIIVIFIAGIITGVTTKKGEQGQQYEIPKEVEEEFRLNCRDLTNEFYLLIEKKSVAEDMVEKYNLPQGIKNSLLEYLRCLESEAIVGTKQTYLTRQLLEGKKTSEGAIRANISQLYDMRKKVICEIGAVELFFKVNQFGKLPKFPAPSAPDEKDKGNDNENIVPFSIPSPNKLKL